MRWVIPLVAVFLTLLTPLVAAASQQTSSLTVKVIGLPRGEKASIAIEGPRPLGHGRTTHRLSTARVRTLSRLPAGSYRIAVAKVKIRHRHESIKKGAVAVPVSRHLRVRVRPGRGAKVDIRYGTVVNPGIHSASGDVLQAIGDPTNPSEVVVKDASGVHRGTILSAHPSAALPQGLLARVVAVAARRGGTIRVKVAAASIFDVAPNMSFDVPLSSPAGAGTSALIKCGPDGSSSLTPFVRINDIHLTGGWTTTHVFFSDITNGAVVELHFKAGAGLDVSAAGAFSCSVPLPAVAIQGMAGPIPAYGGIRPKASGEITAQGKLQTEGSTDVTMGTSIGIPGGVKPILSFGSPRFTVSSQVFTGVKAGVGLDAELGIGAANAANLHLSVGNSLDFTAAPGSCSWDLNLGSFGVGGQIGPVAIHGPSSPPLYHRNLWRRSCGADTPTPTPTPAPLPPPGPLTRATMSWNTDSDIDLYAWDSEGNFVYYGEREGIPGARLVEDVIPMEGETSHGAEIFEETADPNRPYTFGICDFRGEGGDVILNVVDPGGGTRTFHETLYFEGDSAVITSSPAGVDYSPFYEWCRYSSE